MGPRAPVELSIFPRTPPRGPLPRAGLAAPAHPPPGHGASPLPHRGVVRAAPRLAAGRRRGPPVAARCRRPGGACPRCAADVQRPPSSLARPLAGLHRRPPAGMSGSRRRSGAHDEPANPSPDGSSRHAGGGRHTRRRRRVRGGLHDAQPGLAHRCRRRRRPRITQRSQRGDRKRARRSLALSPAPGTIGLRRHSPQVSSLASIGVIPRKRRRCGPDRLRARRQGSPRPAPSKQ
jgi:hypothetical protein